MVLLCFYSYFFICSSITQLFLYSKNYIECLSIYTQLQQIEYTKEKGGVTHAVSA